MALVRSWLASMEEQERSRRVSAGEQASVLEYALGLTVTEHAQSRAGPTCLASKHRADLLSWTTNASS
jgi:hypothetical protein